MRLAVIAMLATAGSTTASRGQILFNTFGPAETAAVAGPSLSVGAGVLGGFPLADGGITLATAFTPTVSANLSRVDLGLRYFYDPVKASGPANLNVTIANDQGGLPGAAIETIQLTNVFGDTPGYGIASAYSQLQPFVQAGTQYWIVLTAPDPRNIVFQWFLTPQQSLSATSASALTNMPWTGPYHEIALAYAVFGTKNTGTPPAISTGGVVDSASYRASISTGSWMSVFGTNLSPVTRSWQASDFVGDALPVSLNDVAVQVDGYAAAVSFISPGQINAQVPDGIGAGMVTVQVITTAGAGPPAQARAATYAPGFFAFLVDGTAYVAARHADGMIVGKAGLLGPDVATRPAQPGEIVSLYGTGFGPTTPMVPAGIMFSGAASLTAPADLDLALGGLTGAVQFAGLSAPGLYQVNVAVPQLPDGDQAISANLEETGTQQPIYLTIRN